MQVGFSGRATFAQRFATEQQVLRLEHAFKGTSLSPDLRQGQLNRVRQASYDDILTLQNKNPDHRPKSEQLLDKAKAAVRALLH